MALELSQKLKQTQVLAPQLMQGLKLLAKSLPELRAEIAAEMAANPAIEDVGHPLEAQLSEVEASREKTEREPDYPEDDFTPGRNADEEAAERRQQFFDNQVATETLQQHLLAQLPTSDIPPADWPMVEVLVGDLNDGGFYAGSIPDVMMVFERTERQVRSVLAKIMELDPPGCGATNARECLLAQMDKLEGLPVAELARKIIVSHLPELAAHRLATIEDALGVDHAACVAAVKAILTLNPSPGRDFPGEKDRVEYVNPEIHAVRREGRWLAETDARSLPEIRLSKTFEALLSDPNQTEETKRYVKERIEAAKAFREAVAKRQETVSSIAQAIFDRQQEFFEKGFAALKPLTESEIAQRVGVHAATVSRTVRDKYAETPFGTVELRRFFAAGVKTADGELVSQEAVLRKLREIVDAEDVRQPLSDEKIALELNAAGFPVARRTVAKYRGRLGIPGASERRNHYDVQPIPQLVS